jgi:hypothetical protein
MQREQELASAFVFTSERSAPFTTAEFARLVERAVLAACWRDCRAEGRDRDQCRQ